MVLFLYVNLFSLLLVMLFLFMCCILVLVFISVYFCNSFPPFGKHYNEGIELLPLLFCLVKASETSFNVYHKFLEVSVGISCLSAVYCLHFNYHILPTGITVTYVTCAQCLPYRMYMNE